jgi:hypothetical protein
MTQPLLEGRVAKKTSDEDLELINEGLRAKVIALEGELRTERTKNAGIDRAVQNIRDALGPFYNGLRLLFGEIDTLGIGESVVSSSSPRSSAVWESWKQRLGEGPAKVIDALLLHREMNTQQLAIATGYHRTTVPKLVYQLNKAGLLNKNGGRFSLKEMPGGS